MRDTPHDVVRDGLVTLRAQGDAQQRGVQLGSPVGEGEVAVVPAAAGLLHRHRVDRVAHAVGGDHLQRPLEALGAQLLEVAVGDHGEHGVRAELRGRDRGGRRDRQGRARVAVREVGAGRRGEERESEQGRCRRGEPRPEPRDVHVSGRAPP